MTWLSLKFYFVYIFLYRSGIAFDFSISIYDSVTIVKYMECFEFDNFYVTFIL